MKKLWKSLLEKKSLEKNIDSNNGEASFMKKKNYILDIFDKGIVDSKTSRRDFMKLCGFSIAISTIVSSCENVVHKAIPYVLKPEEITPGMANYYASTYINEGEYCPILVKTRDARPIKIEGNALSSITNGATNARVQASLLNLYDNSRYKNPSSKEKKLSWQEQDHIVIDRLTNSSQENSVLLTPTIYSPSTRAVIDIFLAKNKNFKWIQYDNKSSSAILSSYNNCFGKALLPYYDFTKADIILSLDSDFMAQGSLSLQHIDQYSTRRKLNSKGNKFNHIQYESRFSLTGSNASKRIQIKPSQLAAIVKQLYTEIVNIKTKKNYDNVKNKDLYSLAKLLISKKGKSIVLSDRNDLDIQTIIIAINDELNNYNNTISTDKNIFSRQAIDKDFIQLIDDMKKGTISNMLCYSVNPVYDNALGYEFKKALEKLDFKLSFHSSPNETSALMDYCAPTHHYLESWDDAQVVSNKYSLQQATIHPIYDTRQFQESLMRYSGFEDSYLNFIKQYWKDNLLSKQNEFSDFTNFWNNSLQRGILELEDEKAKNIKINLSQLSTSLDNIKEANIKETIELEIYSSAIMANGDMANNPWLQELPDSLSKITWDNYASISPKQAQENQLSNGDIININNKLEIPVYILPGQAYNTISVALGYGRSVCGKIGKDIGVKVSDMMLVSDNNFISNITISSIEKTEKTYDLASTQTHHSMEGRDIIRQISIDDLDDEDIYKHDYDLKKIATANTYTPHEHPNHHWAMVIDLNSCIGCSTCSVACQVENNIPVVGKNEILRAHEMSWLRIDRYFQGTEANPSVLYQPVMCQHCDNAPCENVCPVAATSHSNEGLNQMIYNRCIGTRYCGNNCPYKVRRFNWYDYTNADSIPFNLHDVADMTIDLKRLVLNPDVVIRAKGVIEKCSLCVQRIQAGKLKAKNESRELKDGEILTACQQACPAKAIVFGDLNDKSSQVSKLVEQNRNYSLLGELNTMPTVSYMSKIINTKEK